MKIYVLTIHNPNLSMGPNMRLQSFLKNPNIEYILPKFSHKKKHSKLQTLKVLLTSFFHLIKNRKHYDLIHVVTPPSYPGLIAVILKKLFKTQYVVDVGDPYAENMALMKNLSLKSLRFKLLKKIDNTVYRNAKHIILTSTELSPYIPTQIPHTTILTGIKRANSFHSQPPKQNKKCLYIGQYGPLQNLEYLIEVFTEAIKKDPSIQLHVIGQGNRPKFESKNIKFFNPLQADAIESLIPKYTCGIVSLDLKETLDYAIPTKLLTYLANGLPVFGTGGKATADLVQIANAGEISTEYNVQRDTKHLLEFLKNRENLENHSRNAILFAKKHLSLENCWEKASKIYLH